jgi:enediyne biosynthesis protein E4
LIRYRVLNSSILKFLKLSSFGYILLSTLTLQGQLFTEEALQRGVDHVFKHTGFIGGGAVFFDYDNDGDDDLYITGGRSMDQLYENNGEGIFINNTFDAQLNGTINFNTMGVIAGDIDNDGYIDLFVTVWQVESETFSKNLLFKNNGNGTFTDIWAFDTDEKEWSVSACFIDYDQDGYLDIYVGNYIQESDFDYDSEGNIVGYNHRCGANQLYRNINGNSFIEMGEELKVNDTGCTLAVMASDVDNDHHLDLFSVNDFGEFVGGNQLYRYNESQNLFNEISRDVGTYILMYGMGISSNDFNHDGLMDYYLSNLGENKFLKGNLPKMQSISLLNQSDNTFNLSDTSSLAVSWGSAFDDFDNDMDVDLYIGNGFVPTLSYISSSIKDPDVLLINDGTDTFQEVENEFPLLDSETATRGVITSDIDQDGDIDIMNVVINAPMSNTAIRSRLLINQSERTNWLQVKLVGTETNRSAIGSKVKVFTGDICQTKEVHGGSSYASQNSLVQHFGLGPNESIDSILIYWLGDTIPQVLYDIERNQKIELIQASGLSTSTLDLGNNPVYQLAPNPAESSIRLKTQSDVYVNGLTLIDHNGHSLFNLQGFKLNMNKDIELDLTPYPTGIYFLRIEDENGQIKLRKIIKQD